MFEIGVKVKMRIEVFDNRRDKMNICGFFEFFFWFRMNSRICIYI